ncbi:uncharacterized protein [Henckelia pumila]|uniref:uncharacterized protein isoform X2 n=1 Tax=Henckelia pumila TaxID=405737 RepID=UPI003C6E551A
MASVSDNSAASKESEKELKKVDNLEHKEPVCAAGEKIEEKKIEPEEVKEVKTDEEPKAAEPACVAAAKMKTEPPVAEEVEEIRTDEKPKAATAQKVDEMEVEFPTIEKEPKTEDSPITEGAKATVLESETTNNSEPSTECKSDDEIATGSTAETEESKSESVEEKIEKLPNKVEELPAAEVETIVPTDVKVSKISESIPSVEEKPFELPEVTESTVKEPIAADPVKNVEVETGIDKVEDSKLPLEVEAAKVETVVVEISDQLESDTPEIKVQVKDVEYYPSGEVLEKTVETKAKKIIEPKKNEAETAEKSVVANNKSSAECGRETEKPAESEVISRDIGLDPENEKIEETVVSSDTNVAAEFGDKTEKEATIIEAEAKEAEKTPVTETKLEKEKKDDEAVNADAQHSACTKDSEETKTSQDVPKEDVPVKTQKQSNNIIKMVKHSLGKAKKAIIGKSQNSKAPAASETKDGVTK